ncbi:tRNA (N6-isopentenyl adenosine(37)-C2)-methylthiotransferase MiaB [Clostridium sp.]|uniref:tRNA (N6-isopentenyl adenosine(37)-C2)-methylthiotransferase MiaB n=1 Tax=Clostridium sp. TaxID=1506 RepID=UPI002FDCE61B
MENKVRNKSFFISTYGCQMNEEDSEKLSGILKKMGYKKAEDKLSADLIIFNTCCVRENAELKVYGNLGALKNLKKQKPELIIALCGCMMQQKGMAEKVIKKFPFVDIIFGTHNAYKFPEYLNRVNRQNASVMEIQDKEDGIVEGVPIDRESSVKAFVTIMYGCNNFCSYCIVPYVRGRERSRKPEDIENEIKELVSKGYKEVTLLGQNVNSYGKNLNPKVNFSELLKRINDIEGIERIRFMTSHPKDLTEDVIEVISKCDKICEHIHLPVQSGSTRILKKMNRSYSKEQYLALVNRIRDNIPGASITTDIIVGFPGETEEDFQETLNLAKEVEFDSAFTFIYSKREGTPAYDIEEQISEDTKHERFNRLVEIINESSAKKNKAYKGRIEEILVEGPSKNDNTKLMGRTRTGKLVNFQGDNSSIGKLVKVEITKATSFSLVGKQI